MKGRYLLTLILSAVILAALGGAVYRVANLQAPGPIGESESEENGEGPIEGGEPNVPPLARFSWQPENPRIGERITFDASNSQDPDGELSLFRWRFGSGDPVEARGPLVFRTFHEAGVASVELTVVDEDAAANSTKAEVTIRSVIPFQTLHRSYFGNWGEPEAFLIRDETRWAEVWGLATGGGSPPPVDFSAETVVLMGLGFRPSDGYAISVHEVLFDGSRIEVEANVTYHLGAFVFPVVTQPVHIVKIKGAWSDATFTLRHYVFDYGEVVFRTERDRYSIGEVVSFSVRNELLNQSTYLTPKHHWIIYRSIGTSWRMIWFEPSSTVNVTLGPGDSRTWSWSSGATEGSLTPGVFRLELYMRTEHYWSPRFITFFTLS